MPSAQYLWEQFVNDDTEVDLHTYIENITEVLDSIKPSSDKDYKSIKSAKESLYQLKFEAQRAFSERDYLKELLKRG